MAVKFRQELADGIQTGIVKLSTELRLEDILTPATKPHYIT